MKSIFTPVLIDGIREALHNKEQVILFQNRRGFSPLLNVVNATGFPIARIVQ